MSSSGVREVGDVLSVRPLLSAVAADAERVEHGLDFAREAEASLRPVPGLELARRLRGRNGLSQGWGAVLGFMTPHAAREFAGHGRVPAPPDLHRFAVGVVRLNGETVDSFVASRAGSQLRRIPIPAGLIRERNELVLQLPDANSPLALGVGTDPRLLGIAVESFTIE